MCDNKPKLTVMLTYSDRTVKNAAELFRECRLGGVAPEVPMWGMKEVGIPFDEMKPLFCEMRECGGTTVLEVPAYGEKECIDGAKTAARCGCDFLMGTLYYDSVNEICRENGIKYMPYVGKVSGRPSVLDGECETMISEAHEYLEKGVFGFDLLAYRYTKDAEKLILDFTSNVNAPVCIAGSVNSFARIDTVKESGVFAFTVGAAFADGVFAPNGTYCEQIESVLRYVRKDETRGR